MTCDLIDTVLFLIHSILLTLSSLLSLSFALSISLFLSVSYCIVKDVLRTDRHIPYYHVKSETMEDESDAATLVATHDKLQMMRDILITFSYTHSELGYVQGMSDLLSPILFVMDNEPLAFWAFCQFMEQTKEHFAENGALIQEDLRSIEQLVRILLPDLYYFLKSHMVLHFFFCYRWILVLFKREFAFDDVCRLWEVGSHFCTSALSSPPLPSTRQAHSTFAAQSHTYILGPLVQSLFPSLCLVYLCGHSKNPCRCHHVQVRWL